MPLAEVTLKQIQLDMQPALAPGAAKNPLASHWLALVVCGLAVAAPVFIRPFFFIPDDGLFYPQIAWHIVNEGWSTFNGITSTNGYQPLWMGVNLLAALLGQGQKLPSLYLLLVLQMACLLGLLLGYRQLARSYGLSSGPGLALLLVLFAPSFWGMEAHASAGACLLAVWQLLRALERPQPAAWLLLGVFCALAMLARLDNLFLIPSSLALALAYSRPLSTGLWRCLLVSLPSAGLVLPYLLFNQLEYGGLRPISGAIKSSFPHVTAQLSALGPLQKVVCLAAALALPLLFTAAARRVRPALAVLTLQTLLQGTYVFLFTHHSGSSMAWYAAVGCLELALVCDVGWTALESRLARYGERGRSYAQRGLLAVTLLSLLGGGARAWLKAWGYNVNPLNELLVARITTPRGVRWQEETSAWMRAHLPPQSRVAVLDFPGFLAFQSDLGILSLDGLTNDYAYNRELAEQGIAAYLQQHGVRYFLGIDVPDQHVVSNGWLSLQGLPDSIRVDVSVPLTRQSAGAFSVRRQDVLLDVQHLTGEATSHGPVTLFQIAR